ncbi:MAG: hypothetical protein FJ138_03520 [Deltaproteobacteria bacterium]|nr:hypothetical protein [Deltaproteobacteria bacterium]
MSAAHLRAVEALIAQAQEFLSTVQQNIAPDVETFDEAQAEAFEALTALGPVDPSSEYADYLRGRLEYLEALNREMVLVVQRLLTDARKHLETTSTGRRGLTGYQRSLMGAASRGKGVWRGQG